MNILIFKDLRNCKKIEKNKIRAIRNQKNVRKFMYSDHIITETEHKKWLKKINKDNNNIIFIILLNNTVLGCVSANNIDWIHKNSGWALYLDENYRSGLGVVVEFHFLNFIFNKLKLKKLNSEVIETNKSVINMHINFGFVKEGLIDYNIKKKNKRLGVILLGLTDKEWSIKKTILFKKFRSILNKFRVKIEYEKQ